MAALSSEWFDLARLAKSTVQDEKQLRGPSWIEGQQHSSEADASAVARSEPSPGRGQRRDWLLRAVTLARDNRRSGGQARESEVGLRIAVSPARARIELVRHLEGPWATGDREGEHRIHD